MDKNILCVFCGEPYSENMLRAYDSFYGCETGCEYVRNTLYCESCGRAIYIKGEFGSLEYDTDEDLEEITWHDIKQALRGKEEYWNCDVGSYIIRKLPTN